MGFNDLKMWSNGYMKLDIQKFAASLSISSSTISSSAPNNTWVVRITCTIKRTSGSTNWTHPYERTLTMNCDGQTYSVATELPSSKTSVAYTHDFTIQNASQKTISYSASMAATSSFPALSASGSTTLPFIARYTTVSTWSVSTINETSIVLNWKTADTCSSIRYGTSTSSYTTSSVNASSGSVTISGLSSGTNYTLYFMPCRKDSGLWGNGSSGTWKSTSEKTAIYPIITGAPNFTIGATNVNITLSNPKSRNTTITIKYGSTTIRTLSTTSGSVTYNSSLDSATWYSKIPNNPSGTYSVTATYGGVTTTAKSGTFYANQTDCTPTFSDYTWADTNATTVALTGNNQVIVNGYSNITATITAANKATAKNSASIQKYVFTNGSQTENISYSSSATVSSTINKATSNTLQVWAVDTRDFPSATITKTGTFINYKSLSKTSASIERVGEVSPQTTLSFEGEYWNGNFGATTNSIQSATYKYKTGSGDWTTGTTDITPTIDGNTFSFEGLVLGDDVENAGFNVQNVYTVVVTVTDKLSTAEWTLTLNSGTPHIAYYKDGIAIKGKYNENIGGKLQVDGKIIENIGGTIKISNSNRQTMQPNIYTTLDFNFTYFNLSNQLSRSGNAVVIGKGINVILATAQWTAWSPSNYGRYLYIKRIRNNVTQDFLFYSLQYSSTINSSAVITVQEGDKIIAGGYQENSSAITLEAYETRTFLQVTILG